MAKKKIFRKLALGPAAILSALVFAILSFLGLIRFNPPSPDDSTSEASKTQTEFVSDQATSAIADVPAESETEKSETGSDSSTTESQKTADKPAPIDFVYQDQPVPITGLVINEIDYDQQGTDNTTKGASACGLLLDLIGKIYSLSIRQAVDACFCFQRIYSLSDKCGLDVFPGYNTL